jgi:hypothetical protein
MTMPTVIAMTSAERSNRRGALAASDGGESTISFSTEADRVSACWR